MREVEHLDHLLVAAVDLDAEFVAGLEAEFAVFLEGEHGVVRQVLHVGYVLGGTAGDDEGARGDDQ